MRPPLPRWMLRFGASTPPPYCSPAPYRSDTPRPISTGASSGASERHAASLCAPKHPGAQARFALPLRAPKHRASAQRAARPSISPVAPAIWIHHLTRGVDFRPQRASWSTFAAGARARVARHMAARAAAGAHGSRGFFVRSAAAGAGRGGAPGDELDGGEGGAEGLAVVDARERGGGAARAVLRPSRAPQPAAAAGDARARTASLTPY